MAQPNTVQLVEVNRVAPPPAGTSDDHLHHRYWAATSLSPDSLPLTFFDIRWLRLYPTKALYFYEISSTPKTTSFLDDILPRLKHSLSLTLRHFLPLAGTVTWPPTSPHPVFSYADGKDAVSLTVAQSSADFHLLSSAANDVVFGATAYHTLVPALPASHERTAVLAFQVTWFPNSGFSIGAAKNHAVLDGKSFTSFVKSWAHLCRSLGGEISLPPELTPSYDRTLIKDPAQLGALFSSQWLSTGGPSNRSVEPLKREVLPDLVRATFHFPRAEIENLRRVLVTKLNKNETQPVRISTFSLTCAYTWVCLVKAEGVLNYDEKITVLTFGVDCRSRLEMPTTYLGNCVAGKSVTAEREGLVGKEGLAVALIAISEVIIRSLDSSGALNGAENWVSRLTRDFQSVDDAAAPRVYRIVWSPRFEVYHTDFGWGRPKKFDLVTIDRSRISICLSDNRRGDGVDIGLVLKKDHMKTFASLFAEGLQFEF